MVLEKAAVPVPLLVFVLNAIVGFTAVPQTTPLAVMAAPPSFTIVPPLAAITVVMAVMVLVVSTGKDTLLVVITLSAE